MFTFVPRKIKRSSYAHRGVPRVPTGHSTYRSNLFPRKDGEGQLSSGPGNSPCWGWGFGVVPGRSMYVSFGPCGQQHCVALIPRPPCHACANLQTDLCGRRGEEIVFLLHLRVSAWVLAVFERRCPTGSRTWTS
jgi:hypothetical protein